MLFTPPPRPSSPNTPKTRPSLPHHPKDAPNHLPERHLAAAPRSQRQATTARRSPPQPAPARRSLAQPAAARRSSQARRGGCVSNKYNNNLKIYDEIEVFISKIHFFLHKFPGPQRHDRQITSSRYCAPSPPFPPFNALRRCRKNDAPPLRP